MNRDRVDNLVADFQVGWLQYARQDGPKTDLATTTGLKIRSADKHGSCGYNAYEMRGCVGLRCFVPQSRPAPHFVLSK